MGVVYWEEASALKYEKVSAEISHGSMVGLEVGPAVGLAVGLKVGLFVGLDVGFIVGYDVGTGVGPGVGPGVGARVGPGVGDRVGRLVGDSVGFVVGGLVLCIQTTKHTQAGERRGSAQRTECYSYFLIKIVQLNMSINLPAGIITVE